MKYLILLILFASCTTVKPTTEKDYRLISRSRTFIPHQGYNLVFVNGRDTLRRWDRQPHIIGDCYLITIK